VREETPVGWRVSPHAHDRAREMHLDPHQLVRAAANPDMTYPSPERYNQPGQHRYLAVSGDLAVVADATSHTIIIVLWHRRTGRHTTAARPTPPPRHDNTGPIPTRWRASRAGSAWDATPASATCDDCGGRHTTPADALACDQLVGAIRGD